MGTEAPPLWFGILGPLDVKAGDRRIPLGGAKLRTLLAALLVDANEVVIADRLVAILWPSSSSVTLANALQSQVSRLRTVLESPSDMSSRRLLRQGAGYLLKVREEELDALRFEGLSHRARDALGTGDWRMVVATSDLALACWRGIALDEFRDEEFAQARAAHLEEQRSATIECRIEAGLRLGQHHELVGWLEQLVIDHPLREALWGQLITALYRSGRQSEALRAYDRVHQELTVELGISPGPELVRLQRAILRHDPTLDWDPAGAVPVTGTPLRLPVLPAEPPLSAVAPSDLDEQIPLHNLPAQSTRLVGRGAERASVADLLGRSRLVTLTGPGGSGKTRLALAVAEEVAPLFSAGVWFVDLSRIYDPGEVVRSVAASLVVPAGHDDQIVGISQHIGRDGMLLVVDGCEHLLDAVALVVEELLARCPGLRVLTTTREELRLSTESVWRVPMLSLPVVGPDSDDSAYLASEAVQLFVQRARSACRDFAPTGEALHHVAQVCRRLDGIPLAVELAAALVGSMAVADIAHRLDDRFQLLAEGQRHSLERHRTLRSTLDWSFELLEEHTQVLFCRLGVFVGDFTLDAAEAVADAGNDPMAVARGMKQLVASSMVSCLTDSQGAARYRMLDTIRQYAQNRLAEIHAVEHLRRRHACYYADLAELAERNVHGPAASEWLTRVVSELPDLRAAMAWAVEHDDVDTGLRLASSLCWFFDRLGLLDDVGRWLTALVAKRHDLSPDLLLRALNAANLVAFAEGEFRFIQQRGDDAIELARHIGDTHRLALALILRGTAAAYEGELDRADGDLAEAETLCSRNADRWVLAWALTGSAIVSRQRGRLDTADRLLAQALDTFRTLGDRHGQILPLVHMALVAKDQERTDDALALANDALQIAREVDDRKLQHVAMCVVGRVELALDHPGPARELLVESIRGYDGALHLHMVVMALEGLAELATRGGLHGDTAALLGFTQRLREEALIALPEGLARERATQLESLAEALGPERMASELERGRAMTVEEAITAAEDATMTYLRRPPR
jgi:predicted ATPase/DNA-binding SARP family transcriptional activator